jgi:hypothetical protein
MTQHIVLRIADEIVGMIYLARGSLTLSTTKQRQQHPELANMLRPLLTGLMPYQFSVLETRDGRIIQDETRTSWVGVNDPRYLLALAKHIQEQQLEIQGSYLQAKLEDQTITTSENEAHG